ncbi:MAG: 23S rRNA pseudouridine(1911/1915/1917) synthase RluD [Arenicella sp.]
MSENLNQSSHNLSFEIDETLRGQRLDKALSSLLPDVSRSHIQEWIKQKRVSVDGKVLKQTYKLEGEEHIEIDVPEAVAQDDWQAEDIPLNIVHEDEDLMVINKQAGLVVHPGAGNTSGTLLNALLHHVPENINLPRAGIVHRLDKDTSGLMVVAKSEAARLHLTEQLSSRTLSREYLALCLGNLISGATIKKRMHRDKRDRRKMTVVKDHEEGKEAITHYRIEQRFRKHTLVRVKLETGRTHQIRVHMTYQGYPLVGDPVYGKRLVIPKQCDADLEQQLRQIKRQALHATAIAYEHPISGEVQSWQAPIPEDMQNLCNALAVDVDNHSA